MGLMGTLAKVAIGYAAARGVDRMSGGQGIGSLLGGGAQVPAKTQAASLQGQMGKLMGGQMPQCGGMQEMMEAMQKGGMGAMPGAAAGADNPMADMMKSLQSGGMDLSAIMGRAGSGKGEGLLSQLGAGGTGLAGMFAALAGTTADAQGQGASGVLNAMSSQNAPPEAEEAAGLMLRAMIQAAKSDGDIDRAEQAKILETLGDDADPSDRAFIQAQLKAPVDPDALAADTPEPQRMQVYSASLMTIRVDMQAEAQYLDRLARALQLDEAVVNMLHMQMGMQPLYA
ncbi:inner membrane protein YebE [Antarctobacter heliothermus]|uniref:Inner membrane protein YebE n=1 Tax=Antarctobacter heliothermus TaxID=74033 RepID=A0A222E5C3_9RHOB|nr:DUF533 domain-containing protein [Antarctobacter heliothermus]ASP21395.1 inner membrane protein YebE [Antarctobacter heliothermus]